MKFLIDAHLPLNREFHPLHPGHKTENENYRCHKNQCEHQVIYPSPQTALAHQEVRSSAAVYTSPTQHRREEYALASRGATPLPLSSYGHHETPTVSRADSAWMSRNLCKCSLVPPFKILSTSTSLKYPLPNLKFTSRAHASDR